MNIYQTCFDLVNTYIFGGGIVTGSYQELVAIALSTAGCLFVFAVPFIIVWNAIKFICGGR